MAKRNLKHSKKVRNLVAICCLVGILLTVSTYAWFIGMKKVTVDSFDIDIATTEGLFLSMNGKDWSYTLDAANAQSYDGNANTWANTPDEYGNSGLIPLSSVGDMDEDSSRMKLYEKGSFTATKGGYRLLASQVNNYTETVETSGEYKEGKGYVAFDLFIKNISGEEYYEENEPRNEEAIYLNTNSAVTVSAAGGKAGSGIENSVRVAFVQLGRVVATTGSDVDSPTYAEEIKAITGITCADKAEGVAKVTGICRNAQIWEPNDTAHVDNAIKYYNKACKKRIAEGTGFGTAVDINDDAYSKEACGTVSNGTAYPTYAVSRAINVEDHVDGYDGTAYNSFAGNVTDYSVYSTALAGDEFDASDYKLVNFPYFTDTMKNLTGENRPQFMTLAPNSITKLRVYIWIEGQDIDNYDFAQLGLKVSVNFGFTKERFEETDFPGYDGPSTDITPTAGA